MKRSMGIIEGMELLMCQYNDILDRKPRGGDILKRHRELHSQMIKLLGMTYLDALTQLEALQQYAMRNYGVDLYDINYQLIREHKLNELCK